MNIKEQEKRPYLPPKCAIFVVKQSLLTVSTPSAEAEDMEESQGSWGR